MKIYGDYTFLLDKLNVWNHSQVRIVDNGAKIVQFADKFLEEQRAASQDAVSISKEGLEYLRDSLSDLSGGGSEFRHKEEEVQSMTAGGSLSLMDGLCRTYILQRLDSEGSDGVSSKLYNGIMNRYKEEISSKSGKELELADHAESLARAYAAVRNHIADGYENGTREVWTIDHSTGEDFCGVEFEIEGKAVRYRKLSMEEEIENLDKAFDKLTSDIAEQLLEAKAKALSESGEELSEEEKEFWNLSKMTSSLVKEIDAFLKRIAAEEALKKKEKPLDVGERLAAEMRNHGAVTAARGRQQEHYENYRKMSRMAADVQTLLGNIWA